MSYRLVFFPYYGDRIALCEGDRAACRQEAARMIRYHRSGLEYPVTILTRGQEWELESDPEGRSLISDLEGVLAIEEVLEPEPDDEDEGVGDEEAFA